MTFRSTYQSPKTVNKKANEFVIGTVKLNSAKCQYSHNNLASLITGEDRGSPVIREARLL